MATSASVFAARSDSWKSVRLERVIVALPRGTVIAHFPHRFWKKWQYLHLCNLNYGSDATIEWGTGVGYFGDWSTEAGKIFHEVLQRRGMNVVGDASELFDAGRKAQAAEILVGGRITEIRGNVCHRHEPLTSAQLHQYLGEFYVKVEWEVLSTLTQRVVHKFQTDGYAETTKSMQNGVMVTLLDAFAAAVANASYDEGLIRILARGNETEVATASYARLRVAGRGRYHKPIRSHLGEVTEAAVTIELGSTHGSGFLISREGYLLTNAHVVGHGTRVPVVFSNGVRVIGEVVRVARNRDVALVKIPLAVAHILPLARAKPPAVADEVYVVGSPAHPSLRSTVTKGIVSALRKIDGQAYIQSDAATTGGNSGGPMVDANGNVVGITVAGYEGQNLNIFIPIDDALKALNVEIEIE